MVAGALTPGNRTAHLFDRLTSGPITGETIYTLSCTDLDGDTVTKTAKVRVLPSFKEL